MNVILGIIIATVAISAMIVFRIIATESVVKERLKASRSDRDCNSSSCSFGCGSGRSYSAAPDGKRRSVPHAS